MVLRCLVLSGIASSFIGTKTPNSPTPEMFAGASPCDQFIRPLLSIPAGTECELIKWKLSLFKNPENEDQSRFGLQYTYGMAKNGTQGFVNDGTSVQISGRWKFEKNDGKLPGPALLQLTPEQNKPISFVQLNNNLLHLLDPEGKLMIGNAAWSYTLNRARPN